MDTDKVMIPKEVALSVFSSVFKQIDEWGLDDYSERAVRGIESLVDADDQIAEIISEAKNSHCYEPINESLQALESKWVEYRVRIYLSSYEKEVEAIGVCGCVSRTHSFLEKVESEDFLGETRIYKVIARIDHEILSEVMGVIKESEYFRFNCSCKNEIISFNYRKGEI